MNLTITPVAAESVHQVDRGVIVHAALNHRIDLDWLEARAARVLDAVQHVRDVAEVAAHAFEYLRLEAVQAHGDALESGGLQFHRMLGEQDAVGGQGDIVDAGDAGQIAHQVGQIGSQQRLATRESQLAHAEPREQAHQSHDFLEAQPFARAQEPILVVESVPGHAVRAAEIAAIHYGDAQVVQGPATRVARRVQGAQGNYRFGWSHGPRVLTTGKAG